MTKNPEPSGEASGLVTEKLCSVVGNSMRFFLCDGDVVCFEPLPKKVASLGCPVVLIDPSRPEGERYVVHRLLWRGHGRIWTRGDWSSSWDSADCIPIGAVHAIIRNGVRVPWQGGLARFWDAAFFLGSRTIFRVEEICWKIWSRSLKIATRYRGPVALTVRRGLLEVSSQLVPMRERVITCFQSLSVRLLNFHGLIMNHRTQ